MKKQARQTIGMGESTPICQGVNLIIRELMRRMAPPEQARRHFDSARVELLKGMRALLDGRIAQIERANRKGQKIQVD